MANLVSAPAVAAGEAAEAMKALVGDAAIEARLTQALADRCRLLALNAAVEATAAGDEGREVAELVEMMERIAAQAAHAVGVLAQAAASADGSCSAAAGDAGENKDRAAGGTPDSRQ